MTMLPSPGCAKQTFMTLHLPSFSRMTTGSLHVSPPSSDRMAMMWAGEGSWNPP